MTAKRDLSRLLRPKSIALFGGGWAENVIAQLKRSDFAGEIWPVHPKRDAILGVPCFRSIDALPGVPDASFIGVNREATVEVISALAVMGAGGATCFASGFLESEAEGTGGAALQQRLVDAAGDMPFLGPNCYGLLNYLDNVTLWPDQHGGTVVKRGVAIIAQSSNIAINMTMQRRALPIAYVVAAGNQAQTGTAEIAEALLDDPRVSAIGLYLEGFGDLRAFEAFAEKARAAGKPVVALKIGRSDKARAATMTHTASLAGNAAASSALLKRLGIIEVGSIAVFLETLKLLDAFGPLPGNAICSVSCSGGEASLMADLASGTRLAFPDFGETQHRLLKAELGPIVTIANPLDYHTFIWGDVARMTAVFAAVMREAFDLCVFVLDLPREDRCDPSGYDCAIEAILAAKTATGARVAVLASLPENLPESACARFLAGGVVPIHGMEEGLLAIDAVSGAGRFGKAPAAPLLLIEGGVLRASTSLACGTASKPQPPHAELVEARSITLTEAESKAALAGFGLAVPKSVEAKTPEELLTRAAGLRLPLALKGLGIAHKSEAGAVVLGLSDGEALSAAAHRMSPIADGFLAEEMAIGGVAELLVGVSRDATGCFLLTLAAGGVMTELLRDAAHLLLPVTREDVAEALQSLRVHALLMRYRGTSPAHLPSVIDAVMAVASFAEANAARLIELDVNPLIARPADAVAVDALIRLTA